MHDEKDLFLAHISLLTFRNLECLNLLLNTGADFNRKDSFGRFVLSLKSPDQESDPFIPDQI